MDSLSVVIPAYNEEKNLPVCVTKVYETLSGLKLDWEIIVVNDGSSDRTGAMAKKLARRYPQVRVVDNKVNRGYGGSLRSGFAVAKKEFIAFVPSDNQFDFSEITRLWQKQREIGADIVSGIRVGGGADPLHRKLNRWAWNTLLRALFGYLASDIDCGFKLFRRKILEHISLTAERGAMIDTQLFATSRARGFTVAEVPLTHLPRTAGASTGADMRVIYQSFVDLCKFWWQLRQELWTERGRAVFRWEVFGVLIVLAVAGFLRLYKIDQYMTFLGDEGRDAVIARKIALGKHFPLIGPGTSVGDMYLGPLYYYMMAPALRLAGFSPVGPAVQVAVIGIVTIALLWWVGRQWFGRIPALLVCLLYSTAPTVVVYSSSSWNPNVMPFFALVAMYSIWKVWRYGYWRWLIVTGVSLAFVLQSHYLGLLLIPAIGLFWLLRADSVRIKYSIAAAVLFLLLMSPLLVFDLNPAHKWLNTSAMVRFFTNRQTTVSARPQNALLNLFPMFSQVNTSLVLARSADYAPFFTSVVVVAFVVCLAVTRNPDLLFTGVWLVTGLLGLALYKQHVYDHYFGFLFPAVFLLLGFLIKFADRHNVSKLAVGFLMLGFLILNFNRLPVRFPPNNQLNRTRQVAALIESEARGRPFNLALLAKRNYDQSYRYILETDNAPYFSIHDKLTDQLFVICEDFGCEPVGNPLWEIAAFGWAKVDKLWEFSWGIKVYRLVPNPTGRPV